MKIKTSELTGAALDWAVAKTQGIGWWAADEARDGLFLDYARTQPYSPSTNWSQGGPIIELEDIYVMPGCGTLARVCEWDARIDDPEGEPWQVAGPTALIAAMRCYVASRLGDEVDVPEELL